MLSAVELASPALLAVFRLALANTRTRTILSACKSFVTLGVSLSARVGRTSSGDGAVFGSSLTYVFKIILFSYARDREIITFCTLSEQLTFLNQNSHPNV